MAGNLLFSQWMKKSDRSESVRRYGEIILRLMEKFDLGDPKVQGEYSVAGEDWPLLKLEVKTTELIVRYEPGRWPNALVVSVHSSAPIGSVFGLFDPTLDLRIDAVEGMQPSLVYGPYRDNQSQFSCELEDEWDLAMLVRIVRSVGLLDWAAIPQKRV